MSALIYGLCAFTAFLCSLLLLHAYENTRNRLLLWGGICFAGLTVNNILVVIDKTVPDIDLSMARLIAALMAMIILLYGLIWDTK